MHAKTSVTIFHLVVDEESIKIKIEIKMKIEIIQKLIKNMQECS